MKLNNKKGWHFCAWLHERATVLRYTHIACLVTEHFVILCIKLAFTIMNVRWTICGLVGKAFNIERVGTVEASGA